MTVLPFLAAWLAFQVVVRVAGTLMARRRDVGDEGASTIRRVVTQGRVALAPTSPELRRIEVDLIMAGADVDLSALRGRPAGGIDVLVRAAMGGLSLKVPAGWTVWWEGTGVGGIGLDRKHQPERAPSEQYADVRVRGRFLFGGAGIAAADGPASAG